MTAPESSSPLSAYSEGLTAGELRYQRCNACGRAVFYPRVLCPHCSSTALVWSTSSGSGTVYSATVVRSRAGDNPVALIDLDEGFRMMCRLDDPADARPGTRVRAIVPPGTTIDSLLFTRSAA